MENACKIILRATGFPTYPLLEAGIAMSERLKGIDVIKSQQKQSLIRQNTDQLLLDSNTQSDKEILIADAAALSINVYPISGVYNTPFYSTKSKKWHLLTAGYNMFIGNGDIFAEHLKYSKLVDKASGLHSYVFLYVEDSGKVSKVAYTFRGTTDFIKDGRADIAQGVTGNDAQYTKAYSNALEISYLCKEYLQNAKLYYFGHSLGGGLAMFCAIRMNGFAIAFNAASVNPITINKYKNNYVNLMKSDKLLSINLEGELLSSRASDVALLPKPGYRITIDRKSVSKNKLGPIESHKMEYICSFYGLSVSTKSNHYI